MNNNEYLSGIINEHLGRGQAVVIATIISLQGSSPRHSGTWMIIGTGEKGYGTIGGSLLEATVIKESQKVLQTGIPSWLEFDLTGTGAESSGMICGGKAEVMLDYVDPCETNRNLFGSFYESVREGNSLFFLTQYKGGKGALEITGRSLISNKADVIAGSPLDQSTIDILKSSLHEVSRLELLKLPDSGMVILPVKRLTTMYCFGAGHVAVPTCHIAALTGFQVVVTDDRSEFANKERFPEAAQVRVISDFDKALEGLEINRDSFIVIVTRGHQYDRTVLKQSLNSGAGYIGMISSRRKKEQTYQALMEEGVKKEQLDAVYSPIGLPIGGETPEEIAVSIVAELIKVRNSQLK